MEVDNLQTERPAPVKHSADGPAASDAESKRPRIGVLLGAWPCLHEDEEIV